MYLPSLKLKFLAYKGKNQFQKPQKKNWHTYCIKIVNTILFVELLSKIFGCVTLFNKKKIK